MFRRRAQRIIRRMARREDIPPALQQANQMMENGEYKNAAKAFHTLAKGAEERFPHRAPFLYIEAGRAAILGGEKKSGMADLRSGLTILATQGRFSRMQILGQRIIHELQARGLNPEAEEIANLLSGNLPSITSDEKPAPEKRPVLPTHCPSCGASVKPDEVEWLDEITAECSYCGSPIRDET